MSSTKINELMRVLPEQLKEDKTHKAIIFSQFVSFFGLLEPYLKKAGIKYVTCEFTSLLLVHLQCISHAYSALDTGSMNAKQKAASLEAIREDPKVRVILLSLKCGALGLNLTCCNIVCMLDLWWNHKCFNLKSVSSLADIVRLSLT